MIRALRKLREILPKQIGCNVEIFDRDPVEFGYDCPGKQYVYRCSNIPYFKQLEEILGEPIRVTFEMSDPPDLLKQIQEGRIDIQKHAQAKFHYIMLMNNDEQFALEQISRSQMAFSHLFKPTDRLKRFYAMKWKI